MEEESIFQLVAEEICFTQLVNYMDRKPKGKTPEPQKVYQSNV